MNERAEPFWWAAEEANLAKWWLGCPGKSCLQIMSTPGTSMASRGRIT